MSEQLSAELLSEAIRQVGLKARSEEDVRFGVEHALSNALQQLGINHE